VATLHRTDADMVFLQAVAASARAEAPELTVLLSCGACSKKGGEGKFLIVSDGRCSSAYISSVLSDARTI
jgi:hypothetical protein